MKNSHLYILLLLAICFSSCKKWPWDKCDRGEGGDFEEVRNFQNFSHFQSDIPAAIRITQDTSLVSSKLILLGQKNVLPKVCTQLSNGRLQVFFNGCFKSHNEIRLHLVVHSLESITLNSSSSLTSTGMLHGENHMKLHLNESASVNLSLGLDSLSTFMNSSSTCTYHGYIPYQRISALSSGIVRASELITDTMDVRLAGTARAEVYVTSAMKADITSSSRLTFGGEDTLHITKSVGGNAQLIDLR